MQKPIKVLITEDSEDDAAMLIGTLQRGGYDPVYEIVDTPEAMADALNRQEWDLVIADYSMPLFSGLDALKLLQDKDPDLSFILMTGQVGEYIAVEAMKAGAHDYILKSNPARLIPAIERESRDTQTRRKNRQNEQALRESQERYRLIVETANEGIWQIDKENRTTFVNQKMAEMLGYTVDEMMGQTPYIFMDEEWSKVAEANTRRRSQGIRGQFEYKFLCKDGRDLWAIVSASPIFLDDGSYAGAIGMHVDITGRRRSEDALKQSEAARRLITDNMLDMISQTDTAGTLQYVSPSNTSILGYEPEAMLGKSILDFLHPEDRDRVIKVFQEHIRSTLPGRIEYRWRHQNGHYLWEETVGNVLVDETGNAIGAVFGARDITERKQAENELRLSEERFSKAFNACPGPMSISTFPDGRYIDVNEAFLQVLGYRREEVIGFAKSELHIWDKPEDLEKATQILYEQRSFRNLETSIRTKSGELRIGLISADILEIRGEDYVLVVFDDITERKLAEEALKQSEEKYRSLVENHNDVIFTVNAEGDVTYISPAVERSAGYKDVEIIGKPFMLYVHPQDRQGLLESFRRSLSGQVVEPFEFRLFRKDGTSIYVRSFSRVLTENGQVSLTGVLINITERKRAEEELRSAHQRLAQIIEFLPDATFVIDSSRKVIAWNRAIEEMTGVGKESIIGKGDYAYAVPFYGEPRPILIDLVLMEDSVTSLKYEYVEKTNTTIYGEAYVPCAYQGRGAWLWVTASPLVDDEGKITGAIESIRDITEYKRTEEELKKHDERLEELVAERTADLLAVNQELEAFTHSVSHDLRAPLRRIEAFSQILLDDYADCLDKQGSEHLERLKASSQHMSQLIDDLLDLCRVTSVAVNRQQTDLSAMAKAIVADLVKEQPER